MKLLEEKIQAEGKVKPGNILKVDGFLNHQMDIGLFSEMGAEFRRLFPEKDITKILTIEASGIGIACIAAQHFGVPVLFAKKAKSLNIDGEMYTSSVQSYTYKHNYTIDVYKRQNRLFLFDLTHQARLLTAVEACVKKGISSLFDMAADGGQTIYSVSVTPLNHHWLQNGALLLFSDVTKDRTAEKMRAEFVSNASHELKTPVTSIRGFAELLNSGLVADEVQREDYLNRILAESDRLSAIIDDILKLASLEEQPAAVPSVPLDVLGAAEAVKEELAPLSESKQVTIETKGDHAMLCMEEDDLMRLLKNLVENAVKYNVPDGSVTVTVEDAPSAVTLRVADTGIGIAENHLPRIFERFYRVDKGRSRSVGGTGLGLSIVKHIANVYEGQIHIESTVGKGTTISIRFPKK